MVKDKCVHKSGNQPGRVSRVWWRGRDSWMDRWTIWYLDGVTAYLDSYRYLYWECRALAQWYCYNQGDDDITLYRVIRLSQYRICTTNTCLYDDDLQLQSMIYNNAICMIETTLGDHHLGLARLGITSWGQCQVATQRCIMPPRVSQQPALTYLWLSYSWPEHGLNVDKLWCGVLCPMTDWRFCSVILRFYINPTIHLSRDIFWSAELAW